MDATNMTFPDETFDLVIDKGTFDALACEAGDDKELARELTKEMVRTLKVGGRMVLVTHSADRFPFIEAVAPDMLKLEEMDECELSSSATLVNILRSKLNGAPMTDSLKDPEKFIDAIREFKQVQKEQRMKQMIKNFAAIADDKDAITAGDAKKFLAQRLRDELAKRRAAREEAQGEAA